uniref:ShKT domain-containing protein n=1 Tax=Acrobeloides nanus TaxID=290746 RepID=A0A914D775_9BILA
MSFKRRKQRVSKKLLVPSGFLGVYKKRLGKLFPMYKLILVLFLGVLYNSLSVEAQAFSPCPHTTAYVCDDVLDTESVCLTGAQSVLAQYCPATCGLCKVGNCSDVIDCTGLSGGCFDPATQAYMYANCAKTCGCPYGSGSFATSFPTTCIDTNSNCATWNRNGFCASTYYTSAQKAQYCSSTCGLCSISSGLSGLSGLSVSSGLSGLPIGKK